MHKTGKAIYHKGFKYLNNLSNNFEVTIKLTIIGERAKRARHSQVCSIENRIYIIGERAKRAKRARHSQVCSIENRILEKWFPFVRERAHS